MSASERNKNPLLSSLSGWVKNHFSDPQAVSLFFTIVLFVLVIEYMGRILEPILFSIVIAYLLIAVVQGLERIRCPRGLAVAISYLVFIGVIVAFFMMLPALWRQLASLIRAIPSFVDHFQEWLSRVFVNYPAVVDNLQSEHVLPALQSQASHYAREVLAFSVSSIVNIIELILYVVLVPIMVFFFLKDSHSIAGWFQQYLPSHRSLLKKVWADINVQIMNYVRGRIVEMLIVGVISAIVFKLFGLQYSLLLGLSVGASVIIPYVGAVIVTIPVLAIGLIQWGWSAHFVSLMVAYFILVALDANVLVPVLFSEAMDMHPVAIIASVLIFGGIWGFWGVFFAIPLVTLVKIVLENWPRQSNRKA